MKILIVSAALLPVAFFAPALGDEGPKPDASAKPPEKAPIPQTAPPPPARSDKVDPSKDQAAEDEKILQDLLRRRAKDKPIEPKKEEEKKQAGTERSAPPQATAPRGTAPAAVRKKASSNNEGTVIVARRGRMLKVTDGPTPWAFTFVGDGSTLQDAPLYLTPCQQLEVMEQAVRDHGPEAPFVVSGEVLTYKGKSYLLPRIAKVAPDRGNLQQ